MVGLFGSGLLFSCSRPPAPSLLSTSAAPTQSVTAGATESPRTPSSTPVDVAITVDDLPIHGPSFSGLDRLAIAESMLDTFRRHHTPPVYGFVNGKKVDEEPGSVEVLRRWISAGHPLGNHTFSHISLNEASVPDYLADLERGETILKSLVADERAWKVFRYPFLFEGDTPEKRHAVRADLARRGYTMAQVSIDADDWAYNPPFARCTDRRDAMSRFDLRRMFVEGHLDELRRMRTLTREIEHREVAHVLLLHIGAADADALDELMTAYENEGVRWVTLTAALRDTFYAFDPDLPMRAGASFPYRVAKARGVPVAPAVFARGLEETLDSYCR